MRPHRTDAISLTFGLIFLSAAGWWLVSRFASIDPVGLGWSIAGTLLIIGLIGLVSTLRGNTRTSSSEPHRDSPGTDF